MKIINKMIRCIKNPKILLCYLDRFGLYRLDDFTYLKLQYENMLGEKPNIENRHKIYT